jgi:hypothetical protein
VPQAKRRQLPRKNVFLETSRGVARVLPGGASPANRSIKLFEKNFQEFLGIGGSGKSHWEAGEPLAFFLCDFCSAALHQLHSLSSMSVGGKSSRSFTLA